MLLEYVSLSGQKPDRNLHILSATSSVRLAAPTGPATIRVSLPIRLSDRACQDGQTTTRRFSSVSWCGSLPPSWNAPG